MDVFSYIIGLKKGTEEGSGRTVIDGDCTFTDSGSNGNVVITKEKEGE